MLVSLSNGDPPYGDTPSGNKWEWVPEPVKKDRDGRPIRRSLAIYLANHKDRFADGMRATPSGSKHARIQHWKIQVFG